MPKPKILVTTSTLPRFAGDPQPRFVLDLAKGLQKHFDVTVLAPADPKAALEENLEGVHVVRYRYAPARSMELLAYPGAILPRLESNPANWTLVPLLLAGLYRATRRLLNSGDFACVHCHWLLPQGAVQAMLFRRPSDPPFVVTSHGADAFALNQGIFRRLKRFVIRHAAALTVVSEAIRQLIVGSDGLGLSDRDIEVIPMGVDLQRFSPRFRDEGWTARYGLTRPVILFVGRLDEKKGVTYLLQAMAMEPLQSTSASLAIVGDGPLRQALDSEAQSLGIAHRVRFFGAMDHQELPTVYASADVFCAPSVVAQSGDREAVGIVLFEAAASALPSVATRVGGIPEVVRDGETGILVAEKDPASLALALHAFVINDERRVAYGKNALKHVRRFDWEIVSEMYSRVIRRAIAGRGRE